MIVKHTPKMLLVFLLCLLFISQSCLANSSITPFNTSPVVTSTLAANTQTPTKVITQTPDEAAALDFFLTDSIRTIISTVQPAILASYASHDRNWRVEVIRYECATYTGQELIAYEQLTLVNQSSGTEQIVDDQHQSCGGVGAAGFEGLYWSPNDRYFYYSESREGFPDGGCSDYFAFPIYRLDRTTGETILVGGGPLSPDRTKLALWDGNELVIWDLDQGEVGRVQGLAKESFNGEIAWSPDSQSIAYLQMERECAPDYGTTYVTRLDLSSMVQTLLLKSQPPGFSRLSWDTPDQITLTDGMGTQWNYSLIDREITFIPTPATPPPPGVFPLILYPPLVMNYDASTWKHELQNYLQSQALNTCIVVEQGPTDFNGTPPAFVPLRLGNIRYSVIFWGATKQGDTSAWYIDDQSLKGYDYKAGLPILGVYADPSEWDDCKVSAENVLSTLHIP